MNQTSTKIRDGEELKVARSESKGVWSYYVRVIKEKVCIHGDEFGGCTVVDHGGRRQVNDGKWRLKGL